MRITEVSRFSGENISIQHEDGSIVDYIRYSPEAWMRRYGESDESCYSEEKELEAAYQAWKSCVVEDNG